MTLHEIGNAQYIALETFRKNGQGVTTPVWPTPADGKLYVWTAAGSWKVKRIRNNKHVRVCQSDYRGNPQSDWVEAQARILNAPEEDKAQRQRLAAKYGWQYWLYYLLAKLGRANYVVVEISPA